MEFCEFNENEKFENDEKIFYYYKNLQNNYKYVIKIFGTTQDN